ncbi:MAG: SDR family oxidoreductase [Solirubrobacterales bacterium]
MKLVKEMMDLTSRVAMITGATGLLGVKHAEAIAEMGGIPVILDLEEARCQEVAHTISKRFGVDAIGIKTDITRADDIERALSTVLAKYGRVDILINNAANNPKVDSGGLGSKAWSRVENFPLSIWEQDIAVGLTGAFLCCQIIGTEMANRGGGVVLNVASDLAVIAPDQRIYRKDGLPEDEQPVKPVTYSVVKSGLVGLTKYLATYWAQAGVRVNAISPGGVYVDQPPDFVTKLTNLIPIGRMAHQDEYKAVIVFLVSEASSFMTGQNLVVDGGRTCW